MELEGIFIRTGRRINKLGELGLPKGSTRRFVAHWTIAAAFVVPIGHDLIDRTSNPLEHAINKQGDKVGKKVDDMHSSADEKLQAIYDYAKSINVGWNQVQCDLKKMGFKVDAQLPDCNSPQGQAIVSEHPIVAP